MDLDQPATEEFTQHYAQKYSDLKKALKFKETFIEVEPKLLCKALKFTSNLAGDLYSHAKCVEDVESFAQKLKKKFNSEYGPDINNERLQIIEFLYLVKKFLVKIFQKFFDYESKSESSESESSEEKEDTEDSEWKKLTIIFLTFLF